METQNIMGKSTVSSRTQNMQWQTIIKQTSITNQNVYIAEWLPKTSSKFRY